MLREIEIGVQSTLLKSRPTARALLKAGCRPDLMPSPMGRDLARLVLRLRDARGDITEDVEAQIPKMRSLGAEGARLLALARGAPRPDRAQALAFLAALELSETSERLRGAAPKVEELLGPPSSHGTPRTSADLFRASGSRQLRRVTLPEPGAQTPVDPPEPRKPSSD